MPFIHVGRCLRLIYFRMPDRSFLVGSVLRFTAPNTRGEADPVSCCAAGK